MTITRIDQYPSNDFTIENNHARMSQRKVAQVTLVSLNTVNKYISVRITDDNIRQEVINKGMATNDLIQFLEYIVLDSKRTEPKVKKHCLILLLQLVDKQPIQDLFEKAITSHYQSLLNRPKENLIDNHVETGSFVYLIKNLTTGNLKIGYSTNPCQRFIGLQQSTDCDLKLLAFFEGTVTEEQALLLKYSKYQVRGEWFAPVPEIYLEFGLTHDFVNASNK